MTRSERERLLSEGDELIRKGSCGEAVCWFVREWPLLSSALREAGDRDAVIEECAMSAKDATVAREWLTHGTEGVKSAIAAAIRQLKSPALGIKEQP